jgi:NADH-quinone oxidoreductase subunit N
MTTSDLVTLLPYLVLAVTAAAVMLGIAIRRSHPVTLILTLSGLAVALATVPIAASAGEPQVTPLLSVDHLALLFVGIVLTATFAVAVLSYRYLDSKAVNREELYLLLLLAALGSVVLVAARHFASFFLGLEILSIALYTLLAYRRERFDSIEAGLKYLILAATAAAFLLFGMGLLYADTGTLEFGTIAARFNSANTDNDVLFLAGAGMLIIGIGYKLAVVPFHFWTPDVYEGAPAPVAAFVATVSKGAMFALLLRLFTAFDLRPGTPLFVIFVVIAVASMLVGNILGMLQNNLKRILACSSIAHMGYLLVAFLAGGAIGIVSATFYLVTYIAATLGAFAVVTMVSNGDRDRDYLGDYRGVFWSRPWLGGMFTVTLLSLAGIPLTGGFIGKFYLVQSGAQAGLWLPVLILVVSSVIGLFYYLRVVLSLFSRSSETPGRVVTIPSISVSDRSILVALTLLIVWLGVYPGPILQLIQSAVAGIPS